MTANQFFSRAMQLGFCDGALCSAASFDAQKALVFSQPSLSERKQLHYAPLDDDSRTKSLAVLLWPYAPCAAPTGTQLFVDSYYTASNAAYHAARQLEKVLTEDQHYVKANVSYPAKEAAVRAGLGIVGHNSLFIHPKYGTRVVIILLAVDFPPPQDADAAARVQCLKCMKCAKACPSGAIDECGMSHPERCLRNFMMEGVVVAPELRAAMGNKLLGCDICQRVCPMQPAQVSNEPSPWTIDQFASSAPDAFSESVRLLAAQVGKNTARPQRVRAQIALLCGNIGTDAHLPILHQWAQSDFDAVSIHAQWAIRRIGERMDSSSAGILNRPAGS